MLWSFLTSLLGGGLLWLVMFVMSRTRTREVDGHGNLVLRYLAAPYLMFFVALVFLGFAAHQWSVPLNRRYAGNLLLLSYVPAMMGAFCIAGGVYFLTFRATLRGTGITVSSWPFGTRRFDVGELEAITPRGRNAVLRFRDGTRFVVYCTYSGRTDFLAKLDADRGCARSLDLHRLVLPQIDGERWPENIFWRRVAMYRS